MIFYFSGTGNSEGIAILLAERLRDQAANIIGAEAERYCFGPDDRVGFVFPIYAYVAPGPMLEFAKKIRSNGAYTFAVPTFSNAAGCTLEHFSQTACHLDGGFGIKMPDNMPVFDKIVETRETAVEKLRLAIPRFEAVAEKIANREHGFDIHYGPTPEAFTWEGGIRYLKENPFKTTAYHVLGDACIGCGICAEVCPAKAIEMEDGRPVWIKEDCYVCMACLNHCPTEAVQYGQFSEGKYRYLFKGFDLSEY